MSNDGFESVKGSGQTWEPKQTGSSKTNNLQALQPGDDSWIVGYYLGCQTGVGDNNSIIHEIKVDKVGNQAHLVGDADPSGKVNVWGTGVLNSLIAKKIVPGQYIKVVWQGIQKHKSGGRDYHGWDVLVNSNVEPLGTGSVASTPLVEQSTVAEAATPETEADENDDMPF
ncbi:MAG: hypothetical protein ACTSRU_00725 [Candidatus Hodarchaeales archaeon]